MKSVTDASIRWRALALWTGPASAMYCFCRAVPCAACTATIPIPGIGAGAEIRSDEVVADILRYRRFLKNGGVTLSGASR